MLLAISFSTCNRVGKGTAWNLISLRIPDQTARMRRLVWIHADRKPIMLVLL
jgi:hypothetical protein